MQDTPVCLPVYSDSVTLPNSTQKVRYPIRRYF